ncbi:MAG TPA: hypothetical protein V6D46_09375 [Coleofasciculaceae cyanobacterium]
MRAVLALMLLGACSVSGPVNGVSTPTPSPTISHSVAKSVATPAPTAIPPAASTPVAQATPARQITEMISVEGESESIVLDQFAPAQFPVVTYFSREDFVAETSRANGQAIARFVANGGGQRNDAAYVTVTVPDGPIAAEQLWQRYTGPGGWLATQGATIVDRPEQPSLKQFGWVKRSLIFRRVQNGEPIAGELYLGELAGKPFVVLVHLPLEYLEGYGPRVSLLLKHLEVR